MPHPDAPSVYAAILEHGDSRQKAITAANRVMMLIRTAWQEDEAQREREEQTLGTALEIVRRYARHHAMCEYAVSTGEKECSCGLNEAITALTSDPAQDEAQPPAPAAPVRSGASWEHALTLGNAEEVEQYNREQRAKRSAFVEGLEYAFGHPSGDTHTEKARREEAAARYPLKKRVPKVIPDPHNSGDWRAEADQLSDGKQAFQFRHSAMVSWGPVPTYLAWTFDRIRTLAALLDAPWIWEDDCTPEEGGAT